MSKVVLINFSFLFFFWFLLWLLPFIFYLFWILFVCSFFVFLSQEGHWSIETFLLSNINIYCYKLSSNYCFGDNLKFRISCFHFYVVRNTLILHLISLTYVLFRTMLFHFHIFRNTLEIFLLFCYWFLF